MKTLITEKCIMDIAEKGQKTLCVDDNTLITPAARDMIREMGIEVKQGCEANACAPAAAAAPAPAPVAPVAPAPAAPAAVAPAAPVTAPAPAPAVDGLNSDMIYQFMKTLADKGMLEGFVNGLTQAMGAANDAPYVCEKSEGLKVIRGNGIKMEVLDTGVAADYGKVMYQEIIGADDGASVNSGYMTVDHCTFDYPVEIQETHHVLEGQMTVTINGESHTAYAGDTFFIQKGSNVRFSSGDTFAKTFYATY